MANKAFDILPPYPEKERTYRKESPKKKTAKKRKSLLFSIALIGFIIFITFLFLKTEGEKKSSQNKSAPTDSKFELFDDTGQSTFAPNSQPIVVRILDGSTNPNQILKAKDLLLNNGFQIEKSDKNNTNYEQTVIYYKEGSRTKAQKTSDALKSITKANLTQSDNPEKNYDILIILGNK